MPAEEEKHFTLWLQKNFFSISVIAECFTCCHCFLFFSQNVICNRVSTNLQFIDPATLQSKFSYQRCSFHAVMFKQMQLPNGRQQPQLLCQMILKRWGRGMGMVGCFVDLRDPPVHFYAMMFFLMVHKYQFILVSGEWNCKNQLCCASCYLFYYESVLLKPFNL